MYNEMEVRNAYVLFTYLNHLHVCMHVNTQSRDYRFKVFLSNDYEFLSHMYGLSGASGKNI